MIVISCFDHSCVMVKPWAEAGFLCYAVDLAHPRGERRDGNIVRVGWDVLDWQPPAGPVAAAFFFPPCTDVAVSGARWFQGKGLGTLIRALELFKRSVDLAEECDAPYMIENPVSTISTYWRRPDHVFDPCDFAGYPGGEEDIYTKKTCLWAGGGFRFPAQRRLEPTRGSIMHRLPASPHRAALRSVTPAGFARAVFEANVPPLGAVA